MVITSSMLFYQLAKKCELKTKKAPSDKLQIKNVRVYSGKTKVGTLYLVDCNTLDMPISSKKPVTFIFINAESLDTTYIPKNCDYAVFSNINNTVELFEVVSDSISELQEWDCKLKDASALRHSLNEFGELSKEIINEPIYILTRNLSLLHLTDTNKNSDNKTVEIDYANELLADEEYHETSKTIDTYIYTDGVGNKYLCVNIFSGSRYIARVMSPKKTYADTIDEGQVQLLRHFFKYLRQVYLRYTDDPLIKSSSDKLHQLIYSMLFNPEVFDATESSLILQNYGWNEKHTYSVIKFNFFKNAVWDEITEYICVKLEETWSNSCAVMHNEEIIWVFNHSVSKQSINERKFYHVLAYFVRDFVCKAGVSDKFNDLNNLPSYLLQAETALKIGQKSSPDKWYFKFSNYALDYMFDRIVGEFSFDQLIHRGVRKLIEYDKKNATEYLNTLRCFLYNNCNSTHTADELYVHRTTLIRRIDKIQEISNINFEDRETQIYLVISFWILENLGYKFTELNLNQIEDPSQ